MEVEKTLKELTEKMKDIRTQQAFEALAKEYEKFLLSQDLRLWMIGQGKSSTAFADFKLELGRIGTMLSVGSTECHNRKCGH